uniref:TRAM domain-containing protein n=1 Tax=Physcomitrium patens TaxID=3218 RepID=A0A7I4CQQ9_PHYPA
MATALLGRCLSSMHCSCHPPRANFRVPLLTTRKPSLSFRVSGPRYAPRCEYSSEVAAESDDGTHVGETQELESLSESIKNAKNASDKPKNFFPKKGQDLEMVCESLAYKGLGLCKVVDTGFVVFCERALPGERLIARILKKKKGFAEAYKLKTLSVHDNAVEAPCEYFGECGGCKTQNLTYEAQLREKEQQVHDLIARLGKFGNSPLSGEPGSYMMPIVPCATPYAYRNKMEFSYGTKKWKSKGLFVSPKLEDVNESGPKLEFALGLHAPGRFDKIMPIHNCLLQHDVSNQVLKLVQDHGERHLEELPPYDVRTHEGFLKHLTIRSGRDCETGQLQLMVNFVTKGDKKDLLQPLVDQITTSFPQVAEVLYQKVEEQCALKGDGSEVLLDLFCGTGTIGLSMAKRVKHVYGYELVQEAVVDARRNAARNGIQNATFIQGDLNKLTDEFGKDFPRPDVVITDPNRPGMHIKLIKYLLQLRARRIVYISCNPATCARDLDLLCHTGDEGVESPTRYRLVHVQPVDMFPQTPHIECITTLELCE